MEKTFDMNPEQLHTHLKKTIAKYDCYRLVVEKADRRKFTIYYPAKAIVISGTAIPVDNITELRLNATSPFCVISDEYEQTLLTTLVGQIAAGLPPVAYR